MSRFFGFSLLLCSGGVLHAAEVGSKEITVPPGGYAWAVYSDSAGLGGFQTIYTLANGPLPGFVDMLPPSATEALNVTAEWLRKPLALKFVDLLYEDVNTEQPMVPGFFDANNDGYDDLVLRSSDRTRIFAAPDWREITDDFSVSGLLKTCDIDNNGTPDSAFFTSDGLLTLVSGDSAIQTTSGFSVPGVVASTLGDMDNDGLADLVVTTEAGIVLVYRNIGTTQTPCFLPFSMASGEMFPMNHGAYSSPALYIADDSVLVCAVGTQQNGTGFYTSSVNDSSFVHSWSHSYTAQDGNLLNTSPLAVSTCEKTNLLCGTRDGTIYFSDPDTESFVPSALPPVPGTYPNMAAAFVNDDEFLDLVAGTQEGTVYFLQGEGEGFGDRWLPLTGIPEIPSGAPAAWHAGLVFGTAEGTFIYFAKNGDAEWVDSTAGSVFDLLDVGEYATPVFFDVNGDGNTDLVSGNSEGSVLFFEFNETDGRFEESASWNFRSNRGVSSVGAYYSRYFSPCFVFRAPLSISSVDDFADEIVGADPRFRDEIAYCIANTPTDVLRAMLEHSDADIFTLNAECVYEAAEKLSYVQLVDSAGGTSCRLRTDDGWVEISGDDYYRFVVHPRILFEVPGRVEATYWNTPRDTAQVSEREYLNFESDSLFGHTSDHHFWRRFIPADTTKAGRTLEQSMAQANTYEEAVLRLNNFLSWAQPEGMMSFGYMTNDLQPMLIYSKAYGSCGEQSILQTALCRAMFIPAYVTGCRGEDHQWNHFLEPESGRWNHWDINHGIRGFDQVWVSGEGVNHGGKTISTISAFGPEGRVWPVTESVLVSPHSGYMEGDSGYTHTAIVDIEVVDPEGVPVEGAMVLARSHWNNANAVTAFDYTDPAGCCTFDLGWEPNGGYSIDVVTPFGSTGSTNIGFGEDRHYHVTYTVPCRIPTKQEILLPPDGVANSTNAVSRLYAVPYFSGSLYTIGEENTGLRRSTDWVQWEELPVTEEVLFMDAANFRKYRSGFNCRAVGQPFVPEEGDTCFAVLDNRNSMFFWKEFQQPDLDLSSLHGAPDWLHGVTPGRCPVAAVCVADSDTLLKVFGTSWIKSYNDLEMFQDDPDEPISSKLVFGPFVIPSGLRDVTVGTSSTIPDTDLDLFLFMDRNGNRSVDGMEELLESSTSPTAEELITIANPDTSVVYWLFLHGWKVGEDGAPVDLGFSFEPKLVHIHSLEPTGYKKEPPVFFSFSIDVPELETGDVSVRSGEITLYPERRGERWCFLPRSPDTFFSDSSVIQVCFGEGDSVGMMAWNFSLDVLPPEISAFTCETDNFTMQGKFSVECRDTISGIETVSLVLDSVKTFLLSAESDSLWNTTIDLTCFAGDTVSASICATDSAGNETLRDTTICVHQRPEVMFTDTYPTEIIFDHSPTLQFVPDFAGFTGEWTVVATLCGEDSSIQLGTPIVDGKTVQFPLRRVLDDGEYTVETEIVGENGNPIGRHSWGFTVDTMTSTTGNNGQ